MAIAFDSTGSSSSNPMGAANSAGDLMIAFCSISNLTDTPTMTYNSAAMTNFATANDSTFFKVWGFYLIAPATGAHSLAVAGSSAVSDIHFVTYSGTKQSGQPDASHTTSLTTGTTITNTLTTLSDKSWTVLYALSDSGGQAASTGSTLRGSILGGAFGIYDSNGSISPAGSTSMSITQTSGSSATIMVSIAPVSGAVSITASFLIKML